jgi:hypothetical protein
MTDVEIHKFLTALPARTGKLATVRADGRPHIAPVWYEVDHDGALCFNTGERTVKGRNLLRDRRAAMCIDDDRPPFNFVMMEGSVEIIHDPGQVREWAERIGGRYMGADLAPTYGERNGVEGELLIRLRPAAVHSAADVSD